MSDLNNLKLEFAEKFKKSEALDFVKSVAQSMSHDEFKKLSYTVMKTAYDKNRYKAVEYMLQYHEKDNPHLLLQIHIQVMLHGAVYDKDSPLKKEQYNKMLKVLAPHFSTEMSNKFIDQYINAQPEDKRSEFSQRKNEILNIFLQEQMHINTSKEKKIKI